MKNAKKTAEYPTLRRLLMTAVITILLGAFFYYSQYGVEVSRYDVVVSRLPPGFSGFKIAHLSDMHARYYGENNAGLCEMVAAENPDIIAITGDILQDKSELEYARISAEGLRKIAPVYYVSGNHEWEARAVPGLREIFSRTEFLQNAYIKLQRGGGEICLVGIEDPLGPADMETMPEVVERLRASEGDPFILMLSHRYDRFDEYVENRVDLVLTGHAHGGLVRLPFTDGLIGPGRRLFPEHTSGVTREGRTVMVTSRGLGNGSWQFRLFNHPELVIVTLKSE